MFSFFNFLDRATDTLAHAFDDPHAPEAPRSRPEAALFLLAAALGACALVLGWELSPWLLGVLGLLTAVVGAGLFAAWSH